MLRWQFILTGKDLYIVFENFTWIKSLSWFLCKNIYHLLTSSFSKVVDEDYKIIVPEPIHLGITLLQNDAFFLQAKHCWATPADTPDNQIAYPIVQDGCVNPLVRCEK